jgi:hypothetical protein
MWNKFNNEISENLNYFIVSYINNNNTSKAIDAYDSRMLIDVIMRIWRRPLYQNKSCKINESTYTHDMLIHLINFLTYENESELLIQWYFFLLNLNHYF